MSQFQKPYFVLQKFNPDGSFAGTSYFYEALGGEQMEAMMDTIPWAVLRHVHSVPETFELYMPWTPQFGASEKGFSNTLSKERFDRVTRSAMGLEA
ncbi:hypothetical protein GRI33_07750 [Brucella sp. BO3]|uniref:hypothetical protein n=1 Tax=unclassified Brucella TaxID=2632610 RepID=UPI00084FA337|nr:MULTISPECIES: hypothetical protein [unclassified Brucella]OEI82875.1 hypothetical protein BA060_11170 [Brucella sp. B13-0095]OEI84352.1 hypothetical protein BA060_03915 [Brucella sp. B13-0095]OEI84660.1 hypothetical protein BA060_02180 [Brucella sp. B13-0095]OEI85079.1 hypothetical protein BA060_00275 [Brucella sp. B13-0095]QMV26702.1 hypothetical protein GRI33_07100 [Brucella sp. BO3]